MPTYISLPILQHHRGIALCRMKLFIIFFVTLCNFSPLVAGNTFLPEYFYFSWGYNRDWFFAPVNIHVKQPALGNDYYFNSVNGHDKNEAMHPWDYPLTIPQYNIRLGCEFANGYLLEFNFDHTKFVVAENQEVQLTGTLHNRTIDTVVNTSPNLNYQLNNGANFLLLMGGKKWSLYQTPDEVFQVVGIAKVGVGIVYPHVENTILGERNQPHFQLGGVNTGIEGALRLQFWKHVYLEPAIKLDYARYWGLRIYEGTAAQSLYTAEFILSMGVRIGGKKEESKTE